MIRVLKLAGSMMLWIFLIAVPPGDTAALRQAQAGDPILSLVRGLHMAPIPMSICPPFSPVEKTGWVVPGRPLDEAHASFVGIYAPAPAGSHSTRLVVMVAYDEDDLQKPVRVYADQAGHGMITDVWEVEQAPPLCDLLAPT